MPRFAEPCASGFSALAAIHRQIWPAPGLGRRNSRRMPSSTKQVIARPSTRCARQKSFGLPKFRQFRRRESSEMLVWPRSVSHKAHRSMAIFSFSIAESVACQIERRRLRSASVQPCAFCAGESGDRGEAWRGVPADVQCKQAWESLQRVSNIITSAQRLFADLNAILPGRVSGYNPLTLRRFADPHARAPTG